MTLYRSLATSAVALLVSLTAESQEPAGLSPDPDCQVLEQVDSRDDDGKGLVEKLRRAATAACFTEASGSAAYWMGKTLADQGNREEALSWWLRGVDDDLGSVDPRLPVSALGVLLSKPSGAETTIERLYDLILIGAESYRPGSGPAWALDAVQPYLAHTSLVLPDSVEEASFYEGDWTRGMRKGGADMILSWWWWNDPLVTTPPNERLREHLYRVQIARDRYPNSESGLGLDTRGQLFVKYGAPNRRKRVSFDSMRFLAEIHRLGTRVSVNDFPDNEIWIYDDISESMVYILVDQAGDYELGTVEDLIPQRLRTAVTSNGRDQERVYAALSALRFVYDELATASIEYGGVLTSIDDYLDRQLSTRLVGRAREREEDRTGTDSGASRVSARPSDSPFDINAGNVGWGGSAATPPGQFVQRVQNEARERDRQLVRAREQDAPDEKSSLEDRLSKLEWEGRYARFRDDDGATRVDLWWRPQTEPEPDGRRALRRGPRAFVSSSIVEGEQQRRLDVVSVNPAGEVGSENLQSVSARCRSASCRVAIQLEERVARVDDGRIVGLGDQLKTDVVRIDDVQSLRSAGFEMSDLQLYVPTNGSPLVAEAVVPGGPLSVYFEAYDLKPSEEGEIVFTVTYTVTLKGRNGLFRKSSERTLSSAQRIDVEGVNTGQFVILNTSDWVDSDAARIDVEVRDNRTGLAISRSTNVDLEDF